MWIKDGYQPRQMYVGIRGIKIYEITDSSLVPLHKEGGFKPSTEETTVTTHHTLNGHIGYTATMTEQAEVVN